jgi:Exportin 1-like protein
MASPAAAAPDLPQLLAITRAALSALHSPVPPPQAEARAAQDALARVQASLPVPSALAVAAELLAPLRAPPQSPLDPSAGPLILFGFHVIDECVLLPDPWRTITDADRAGLRSLALTVLSTVGAPLARANLPAWTRGKAASLVAALAVREWPQHWPDFVDMLIAAATAHAMHDVACDVLRALSEEVYEFGDRIASSRRQQLSKVMALTLDQTLGFIKASTELCFANGDLPGLLTALRALETLLSWCDMEKALIAAVPSACVTMLSHPAAREAALDALYVFVARKPAGHRIAVASSPATALLRSSLFPALLTYISTSGLVSLVSDSLLPVSAGTFPNLPEFKSDPTTVDVENHAFYVRFVGMMADVGIAHFGPCFLPYSLSGQCTLTDADQRVAFAYIQFMLTSLAHPSLAIRDASVRFFTGAFIPARPVSAESGEPKSKRKGVPLQPVDGSADAADISLSGKALLSAMAIGFIHAGILALVNRPTDPLVHAYLPVDFEGDEEEQAEVSIDLRNRIIGSIGAACTVRPIESLTVGLELMHALLKQITSAVARGQTLLSAPSAKQPTSAWREDLIVPIAAATSSSRNAWTFGMFTPDDDNSSIVGCAEAIVAANEAVMAGASSAGVLVESNTSIFLVLAAVFDNVLTISDQPLLALRVAAFRMFTPLFIRDSSRLQTSLQILVSQAANGDAGSDERYRACVSLAVLCRRIVKRSPQSLHTVRQPLCEFVSRGVGTGSSLSVSEKGSLIEAAVTCILTLDTVSEKARWIETLLQPLLTQVDPTVDWCRKAIASAAALFDFVDGGEISVLTAFFSSLYLLETSTHQIVRAQSYSRNALDLPNSLSSTIAPRTVELSNRIVVLLHAMYNPLKFPAGHEVDSKAQSALLPTSREVAYLLNLEGASSNLNAIQAPEIGVQGLSVDKSVASRSDDVLARFGLTAPDPSYRQTREALKVLRNGAYELIRNGILSGVTQSHQHLGSVLAAVSSDYQHLEPLHLYYLVNRVIRTLLCYQVVSADPSFLKSVSNSGVPGILELVRKNVEAIGATELLSSSNSTLDATREHGRVKLARASADLLCSVLPKQMPTGAARTEAAVNQHLPPTMNPSTPIGDVLWKLLRTICGPEAAKAEGGQPSRTACELVSRMCELAPDDAGSLFADLLVICLQTAVANHGHTNDMSAINAVVSITQRYQDQTKVALTTWIDSVQLASLKDHIVSSFSSILPSGNAAAEEHISSSKLARGKIRRLVDRIAFERGFSVKKSMTVLKLSAALRTVNHERIEARAKADADELQLGEAALDALFGDSEPL